MCLTKTESAVSVFCDECAAAFYVTDKPEFCPYCGGVSVGAEYPVAVRPE